MFRITIYCRDDFVPESGRSSRQVGPSSKQIFTKRLMTALPQLLKENWSSLRPGGKVKPDDVLIGLRGWHEMSINAPALLVTLTPARPIVADHLDEVLAKWADEFTEEFNDQLPDSLHLRRPTIAVERHS